MLDPATRAQLRELLRTGRAAVHAEHYDDALTAFEEIVTLDPQNRRLRCEAGYVAYRAGHADRARTLIEAALAGMSDTSRVPEPLRVQTAQCLYNAGLVREAGGDLAGARTAWTGSLALRPNATVQAHLDALPEAAPAPRVLSLGLARGATDAEVDAAIVRRLTADADAEAWGDSDASDFADTPIASVAITADPGITVPPGVAVVQILQARQQVGAVIVHAADQVTALVVFDLDVGGVAGVMNDAQVASARATDLVSGGAPELVLEIEEDDEDQDMAGCIQYASHARRRVVCSLGAAPACAALDTWSESSESCDDACMADPGDDGEEEEEEEGADQEAPALLCGTDGYPPSGTRARDPQSATLTFHDGTAVYAGELAGSHAGTYELAGLFASFAVSVITVHPFE